MLFQSISCIFRWHISSLYLWTVRAREEIKYILLLHDMAEDGGAVFIHVSVEVSMYKRKWNKIYLITLK